MLRLHDPLYLILALLPLMLYLIKEFYEKRRVRGLFHPSFLVISKLPGSIPKNMVRMPQYIFLFAFIPFAIALARPQSGFQEHEVTTEGIDIMICMDISSSMAAEDFQPKNRVSVSKDVIADFIKERHGDRIGLITFAGLPFLRCPLTTDYSLVDGIVKDMDYVKREEIDGTAIGDALASAGKRLSTSKAKSKVVIILTDGENNRGQISPEESAKLIEQMKIRIYTVGIGTDQPVPYPIIDANGNVHHQLLKLGFNEESLKKIAAIANGLYFNAQNRESLKNVFENINKLEKSKATVKQYTIYEETFYPFIVGGAILLLLDLIIRLFIIRIVP